MTVAALVFVLAFVTPALVSSWGLALFAVGVQAACGGVLGLSHAVDLAHVGSWIAVFDATARMIVTPLVLGRTVAGHAAQRFELIPVNMVYWLLVAGCLALGFSAGRAIGVIDHDTSAMLVGGVASGIIFSMFALSVEKSTTGQAIAVLTLENAVFLFENSLEHHLPVVLQTGLAIIYLLTLGAIAYFVRVRPLRDEHQPARVS